MAAPVGLKRAQVIDAAVDVLDESGRLDSVALRIVAERLGVRTQSLYAHVDGLDGLRRDLALRALAELATRLTDAAVGRAGAAAVDAIIRTYLRFAGDHPGLYEAGLRAPDGDPELIAAMTAVMRPLNLVFASYGLDEEQALHWYRIVFAAVHGLATLRRDGLITLPGDIEETVDRMSSALTAQIEAEVRPRVAPAGSR
jgi:AcrR family transcriptional regulator